MPDNKIKVTYSPDLDYKKSYDTVGNKELYQQGLDIDTSSDSESILISKDDILSYIATIRSLMFNLPSEIVGILHSITTGISNDLPYINSDNIPKEEGESTSGETSDDTSDSDDNNDNEEESDNNNHTDDNDDKEDSNDSDDYEDSDDYIDSDHDTDEYTRTVVKSEKTFKKYNTKKTSKKFDIYKIGGKITSKIKNRTVRLPESHFIKNNIAYKRKPKIKKNYDLVDAFDYTMLLVYDKFLNQINSSIVSYNLNLVEGASHGGILDINSVYTKHASTVDANSKHLSDTVVRSEVMYDQKIRLAKKLYNLENSMNHFHAIYTSKEFYNRYKEEKYAFDQTSINRFSNQLLSANLSAYYGKYLSSLENIYKYYNSCAVILSECLNIKAQSFVSKNIIG